VGTGYRLAGDACVHTVDRLWMREQLADYDELARE
jgi:hypothetical protein